MAKYTTRLQKRKQKKKTINRNITKKFEVVEPGEICVFCFNKVEDGVTYYSPPCGHLFCYECLLEETRIKECGECTKPFIVAEPVKVIYKTSVIEIE